MCSIIFIVLFFFCEIIDNASAKSSDFQSAESFSHLLPSFVRFIVYQLIVLFKIVFIR